MTRYLKLANNLGKCDYTKEKAYKRAGKQRSGVNSVVARKVVRLKDGVIYNTLTEAATSNNFHITTIIRRCKKHQGFMYYNEWLATIKNNKKGW